MHVSHVCTSWVRAAKQTPGCQGKVKVCVCLDDKDEPVKPCSKQKGSEAQLIGIADTEHITISMPLWNTEFDLWSMSQCSAMS